MDAADAQPARPATAPNAVATSTLAEIYLAQGHTAQALAIYQTLLARAPGDEGLRQRVRVLTLRMAREQERARNEATLERLTVLLRRVQRRRRALAEARPKANP